MTSIIFTSAILIILFALLCYSLFKYLKKPVHSNATKRIDEPKHLILMKPKYSKIFIETVISFLVAAFYFSFTRSFEHFDFLIVIIVCFPIIFFILISLKNSKFVHIDENEIISKSFWSRNFFSLAWKDVEKAEFDKSQNSFYFYIKNSWDIFPIKMNDYRKNDTEIVFNLIELYSKKYNLKFEK